MSIFVIKFNNIDFYVTFQWCKFTLRATVDPFALNLNGVDFAHYLKVVAFALVSFIGLNLDLHVLCRNCATLNSFVDFVEYLNVECLFDLFFNAFNQTIASILSIFH